MPPRLALAAIVLLGAALRLFPIWFGIPYVNARPDETTTLGHAVAILAGDPNPTSPRHADLSQRIAIVSARAGR